MIFGRAKTEMVTPERALAGSADYDYSVPTSHYVNGHPLQPPFPAGLQSVVVGMGCFWGAEKGFWQTEGVYTTAAGYAGGYTPHPSYEQTCTGLTGHAEVVLVVFDPAVLSFEQLLQHFFESHDPTQGNRQGNDVGSQYRSAIYYSSDEQRQSAEKAKATYGRLLAERGFGPVTTEIAPLGEFYYAEGYHQQYLAKNPHGYCPDHGTGVSCPVGLFGTTAEVTAAD